MIKKWIRCKKEAHAAKEKNESNSDWVNFNSSHKTKRNFSFCVGFSCLNGLMSQYVLYGSCAIKNQPANLNDLKRWMQIWIIWVTQIS